MRRMLAAAGVALGLHVLAFFFWDTYRQLVVSAGGFFSHATDIADIPRLTLIGFIVLAVVAVVLGILLERLDRHFMRLLQR
jgi:hypothetical protein